MAITQGCQWSGPTPTPTPAGASADVFDNCAEQLHDICGELLAYRMRHGELPESLADLPAAPGKPLMLACPVSGKPYLYSRQGLPIPGSDKRVIVYDPLPSHGGCRWAIVADPQVPGRPLVLRPLRLANAPIFTQASGPSSEPS